MYLFYLQCQRNYFGGTTLESPSIFYNKYLHNPMEGTMNMECKSKWYMKDNTVFDLKTSSHFILTIIKAFFKSINTIWPWRNLIIFFLSSH